jgi:hypothetical protein
MPKSKKQKRLGGKQKKMGQKQNVNLLAPKSTILSPLKGHGSAESGRVKLRDGGSRLRRSDAKGGAIGPGLIGIDRDAEVAKMVRDR